MKAMNFEHRKMMREEMGLNKKGIIPSKALQEVSKGNSAFSTRAAVSLGLRKMRKK